MDWSIKGSHGMLGYNQEVQGIELTIDHIHRYTPRHHTHRDSAWLAGQTGRGETGANGEADENGSGGGTRLWERISNRPRCEIIFGWISSLAHAENVPEIWEKENNALFTKQGTGLEVTDEESRDCLKRAMRREGTDHNGLSPQYLWVGGETEYKK